MTEHAQTDPEYRLRLKVACEGCSYPTWVWDDEDGEFHVFSRCDRSFARGQFSTEKNGDLIARTCARDYIVPKLVETSGWKGQ